MEATPVAPSRTVARRAKVTVGLKLFHKKIVNIHYSKRKKHALNYHNRNSGRDQRLHGGYGEPNPAAWLHGRTNW